MSSSSPALLICRKCEQPCARNSNSQRYCAPCKIAVRLAGNRVRNAKYEASQPPRKRNKPVDIERRRKWAAANRAKRLESVRAYNDRNRDEVNRKSRERNLRDERRQYMRQWDAESRSRPRNRLDRRMKTAIRQSLKGGKAGRSWEAIVGYTLDQLIAHIERQFLPGMSWDNIGEWHIDHILPKSQFEYASDSDAEFRSAWALTNLRPLWWRENLSKGPKRLFLI